MASNTEILRAWLSENTVAGIQDAACGACWVRAYYLSGLLMPIEAFEVVMLDHGLVPKKVRSGLWVLTLPTKFGGAQPRWRC